jgi:hypothetical protein
MSELVAALDTVTVPTVAGRRYYFGLSSESWGTATVQAYAVFENSELLLSTKTENGFGEFVALTGTVTFALTSGTPSEPIVVVCGEIFQR